ncbi:hypothetical protein OGATHE_002024 [Ogataea polymorpha]|uniref:Uncharacterized protein n=1 Tax=Ogataea polymorpha TaxID=460523 RepID=A0A9P8TCU4_9ASCO|nr:hypothetical protein OGATHE_002024 [Ogataea polymorpha]
MPCKRANLSRLCGWWGHVGTRCVGRLGAIEVVASEYWGRCRGSGLWRGRGARNDVVLGDHRTMVADESCVRGQRLGHGLDGAFPARTGSGDERGELRHGVADDNGESGGEDAVVDVSGIRRDELEHVGAAERRERRGHNNIGGRGRGEILDSGFHSGGTGKNLGGARHPLKVGRFPDRHKRDRVPGTELCGHVDGKSWQVIFEVCLDPRGRCRLDRGGCVGVDSGGRGHAEQENERKTQHGGEEG